MTSETTGLVDVLRDIDAVFGYVQDSRPQDRAHAYLAEHQVRRGYDDTAMQCAAADMARRAYEAGRDEAIAGREPSAMADEWEPPSLPGVDELAGTLLKASGELALMACELRGLVE